MKIKPVKKNKTPNYPTLEYYIANPELLSRNIPDRWIKNKYIATYLTIFVLCGNTGCTNKSEANNIEVVDNQNKKISKLNPINHDKKDFGKVAPIFAHGEGSGATGCMVISPPVFIAEDEAWQIISTALAAQNITLDTANCPTIKFNTQPIGYYHFENEEEEEQVPEVDVEIKTDRYNAEYNLAIQFISVRDIYKFEPEVNYTSSVQEYNTKKAAVLLREELAKREMNAVVFYDPLVSSDYDRDIDWETRDKLAKEKAKTLLLSQVNDFIEWLKNEHIVK